MSFLSLTQEWREWLEQQHSWDEERVLQHQQWIQVREATVTFHFSWLDPIPPIPPKFTLKPFLPILPVTLFFTQQDRNLQNWRCAIPAAELHDIAGTEGTSNQIWKKKTDLLLLTWYNASTTLDGRFFSTLRREKRSVNRLEHCGFVHLAHSSCDSEFLDENTERNFCLL